MVCVDRISKQIYVFRPHIQAATLQLIGYHNIFKTIYKGNCPLKKSHGVECPNFK